MREVAPKGLAKHKATDLLYPCQSNNASVNVYADSFIGQYPGYQHQILLIKKKILSWTLPKS